MSHGGSGGTGADTLPVSALAVVVIEAAGLGALMPRTGGPHLPDARARVTLRPAVALAAETMPADEERILALTARQPKQNDVCLLATLWHAPAAQPLDNSGPLLSR
jgi:hypothetical protein